MDNKLIEEIKKENPLTELFKSLEGKGATVEDIISIGIKPIQNKWVYDESIGSCEVDPTKELYNE